MYKLSLIQKILMKIFGGKILKLILSLVAINKQFFSMTADV